MQYQDYLAALDRLRRVASGEPEPKVYESQPDDWYRGIDNDKALVYDYEREDTQATVEWLREVLGEEGESMPDHWYRWRVDGSEVLMVVDGQCVVFSMQNATKPNPTRGDVLTLLRVFRERKV